MKIVQKYFGLVTLGITLSFFFNACKKESNIAPDGELLSNYVLSYTNNVISPFDKLYVRFNSQLVGIDEVNKPIKSGVVKMSPKVNGSFVWSDMQTIEFRPESQLGYGTEYNIDVDISKLFDKALVSSFDFKISTNQLYFNVGKLRLKPATSKDDALSLVVNVDSNLKLNQAELKNIFRFTDQSTDVNFINFIDRGNRSYQFEIEPIQKQNASRMVTLEWESMSGKIKGNESIKIPSLNEFKLLSAEVIDPQSGHIRALFSNPLAKQKIDGLVKLKDYDGDYKFTATFNQLDIYVSKDLVGSQTITFDKNILDTSKNKMDNKESIDLLFTPQFPQLRTNNNGNIVPYKDQVIFPFEAVSLDTIEIEVFKIFENNVLDFLRYENLSSTYINHFFGRVILNEKIALRDLGDNTNTNEWARYALDLQKMTNIDPGAVYQVRIAFKKSFTNYKCESEYEMPNGRVNTSAFNTFNYYEGYEYEHNSNPCYPAYYSRDKFIYKNILASNLGLIAKQGKDNVVKVFATDLLTGENVPNVEVKVLDQQQQLLGKSSTDGQGMVDVICEREPMTIVAKNGNNFAYLSLDDNRSNALSSFDVSGVSQSGDINGYLFGERGVWRPGDTLHLSFMLYDKKNTISGTHPVKLQVKDSRGKTKFEQSQSNNENGYYVFNVPTLSTDATGLWTATASLGNLIVSQRLKIETIKPNRLKVNLEFHDDELDVSGDESFNLDAKWLHGAPASNLKAQVDVKYNSINTKFEKYEDFIFDDPARKVNQNLVNVFNNVLDAEGRNTLSIKFGKDINPPGKLKANIRTRVFEKSGNYSEDYTNIAINPYNSYVGVKVPTNRWGSPSLNVEENESIQFVAVDKKGMPLAGKELSVGIYNARWRWWYGRNDNGIYRYNSTQHFEAEEKAELKTNSKGEVEFVPQLNGHGNYLVRVCDKETGHCSGQLFYTSYYTSSNAEDGQIAKLNFTTDKEDYSVGDEVSLKVPSSPNSKLLISLENNQGVVDAFWVESTGETTTIPFKVRSEMIPNVYAHVTLVQGAERSNDLPMRLYGVKSLNVKDPQTVLNPSIKCKDVFEPNTNVNITVSEVNGNEMSYTLAVVDEGLLDITNFKTPDPAKHFFAKQSLGVRTWDLYDFVLNKYGNDIAKIFSVGGDGNNGSEGENPSANRFKSVVSFLGPFTLKKGESITHDIGLPNYIGAVRVMVVGKNRKAFGHSEKLVTVKKPVMVLSTLPRVLAPGEKLAIPVNVFAYQNDINKVTVNVKANELIRFSDTKSKVLNFESQGDKLAYFDVEVGNKLGIALFDFDVNAKQYKAHENVEIDIRNPSPEKTEVYDELVRAGETWNSSFGTIGVENSNEAVIEVSKFPTFNLNSRLNYLIRYPYGCVEQTTSSIFPQLFLDNIAELSSTKQDKIKRNIQSGIRRLQNFQTARGGFSYWAGSTYDNEWGTNYAGHFLLEARNKGYFVSDGLIDNWIKFQKQKSNKYLHSKEKYNQYTQAYRLYTLALSGNANVAAMNQLRVQDNLNKMTKFVLAAAYSQIGQKAVALDLIKNESYNIKSYRELSNTYGSDLRDRAFILMTLMQIDNDKDVFALATDLAKELSTENWYSTQSTAFSLLALSKYLGDMEDSKMNYSFKLNANPEVENLSNDVIDIYNFPLTSKSDNLFSFKNTSEDPLYVRILNTGKPLPEPTSSYANGLKLDIVYKDMDGKIIDPINLKQGTDFSASISVTNTSTIRQKYEELALNHTLPSGWEIQNLRLGDISTNSNNINNFEYQDIRDDRVYTFFDLKAGESRTFVVHLTAAYAGRFFMPNISCEAMYDKAIGASVQGAWVNVTQ